MMDRVHLTLTAVRLALLAAGLFLFAFGACFAIGSLNPFSFIFNMVLFDLVSGRFMATEHQLAERDVVIDFPGRKLAQDLAATYQATAHRARKPVRRVAAAE